MYNEGDTIYNRSSWSNGVVSHYHRYKMINGEWQHDGFNIPASEVDASKIVDELPDLSIGLSPDDPNYDASVEERGLGMKDVTAEDMLGKSEPELLEWIINTKYGGSLEGTGVTENDLLTQIRTKLPQKAGITGTDWYGLQKTAGAVGGASRSAYGGMGTGMRSQVAGQKQIGKDIYALEEGKGRDWTSKFRTFLSGLDEATG